MNYKIVSDSSSNVFELEKIPFASAPLSLMFNDKEHVDTPALDVDAMLDELDASRQKATTSCPNVGQWLDAFEGGELVFAITITSSLSGSYNAAMQAREEYLQKYPERRVHVFDSLSAGPELRLIIEKLCEFCSQGLSFDEIVEKTNDYMKKTHLIFCLSSLKNLARAGRVSAAKAKLAGVLGIRVVGKASDVGTLEDQFKPRGEEKALSVMLESMCDHGYNGGKVRISHTRNEEGAARLAAIIKEKFPESDIAIEKNGALCGYYAEEGGFLVGYEG